MVLESEYQVLQEINAGIKQLVKWTRFAGMQQLRIVLDSALQSEQEKLVFELSDGAKGTREIAAMVGLGSNATVASYWNKWSRLGIVEETPKFKGRYQKIVSLEDVGIEVPSLPKRSEVTTVVPNMEDQNQNV